MSWKETTMTGNKREDTWVVLSSCIEIWQEKGGIDKKMQDKSFKSEVILDQDHTPSLSLLCLWHHNMKKKNHEQQEMPFTPRKGVWDWLPHEPSSPSFLSIQQKSFWFFPLFSSFSCETWENKRVMWQTYICLQMYKLLTLFLFYWKREVSVLIPRFSYDFDRHLWRRSVKRDKSSSKMYMKYKFRWSGQETEEFFWGSKISCFRRFPFELVFLGWVMLSVDV